LGREIELLGFAIGGGLGLLDAPPSITDRGTRSKQSQDHEGANLIHATKDSINGTDDDDKTGDWFFAV
jgi:hypothetical protein